MVIMCIQYIPLEGTTISMFKVAIMATMPLVLLLHFRISKATGIIFIYYMYILYTSYILHYNTFRSSTILYLLLFLITYATFYNLIWIDEVLNIDTFIQFIRKLIFVCVGIHVIQQLFQIAGIREFPLINLAYSISHRGSLSGYSIFIEPSIFSRCLGVFYYTYLKCNEFKQGYSVNIQQIFKSEHRLVTIAFGWSMFTMGSGTAFICLGILSLYFMKGVYFFLTIPIFASVFYILSYFEVQQFERATSVAEATVSMETEEVREVDGSASVRIAPLLNTIKELDFSEAETWFGHGVDYHVKIARKKGIQKIGGIDDYGLIAYIISLVFVFSCAIDFFSLATVMYFLGVGGGTGNVAYGWGILMFFTCLKYFNKREKQTMD